VTAKVPIRSLWINSAGWLPAVGLMTSLLAGMTTSVRADDWPQWRGPKRNSISAETDWLVNWPPEEEWRKPLGHGYSAVAVKGDHLYTMGWNSSTSNDVVYCLDAITGTQIWFYAYGSANDGNFVRDFKGPRATPTIDGTNLYTYSHEGHLYCFDALSGTVNWSNVYDTGRAWWGQSGSPYIEGGLLVLHAGRSGLAVNKNDGSEVWNSGGFPGEAGYSSPFAITWDGKRTAVFFSYSALYGMDLETGDTLWWYPFKSYYNIIDPVVYGNKIFISNAESGVRAFLELGSNQLSQASYDIPMYCDWASPVLLGDHLYGFDDNTLTCVDMRDGSVCWAEEEAPLAEGGLMAAAGKLIVQGYLGQLAVLKATPTRYDTEGRDVVEIDSGLVGDSWYTPPVLANGRIYCRSELGMLVCLRTGPPAADVDRNGMADNWERVHLGGTNGVPNGAQDDADADGLDNRTEYIVGTIPTNAASRYAVGIAVSNTGVVVTYGTQPAEGVGYEGWSRFYRLERAEDVSADDWQPVGGHADVPGDGAMRAHTNAAPGQSGAYRLNVRLESDTDG